MSDKLDSFFTEDHRHAVDAKFEAQKIAFAPYIFQASIAMRKLGILDLIFISGDDGITSDELQKKTGISLYGITVLTEIGLSSEILKLTEVTEPKKFQLGKIGYFLLHDRMTHVNMDFMADICYDQPYGLLESIENGKPEGLKTFGEWPTIYEGLSRLPEQAKESWFAFDHYYSDNAFPEALSVIFSKPVKKLMDIGGNTAKWSLACANFNEQVELTIVDLPGQVEMARSNIREAGFAERIFTHPQNVLDDDAVFPKGHDTVWMSQFLDCFSLEQVSGILGRLRQYIDNKCDVWVLEPLWDRQKYKAAAFSLHATSLYFTAMANGNSKMYSFGELVDAIELAGYALQEEIHELGQNDYSLLRFRRTDS